MYKNRLFKILTVFCLVISTVVVSSVSAFAYVPILSFKDDDWTVNSPETYKVTYPDRIGNYAPDSVYSISELNGKTYYGSFYGEDFKIEEDIDVIPPELDVVWNDNCFGLLYQINDIFYFFYCDNKDFRLYVEPCLQNNNISGPIDYFNFYYTLTKACNVKLLYSSYPYTSWKVAYNVNNSGSALNKLQCRKWHDNMIDENFTFFWCSDKVYQGITDPDGTFRPYDDTVMIENGGISFEEAFQSNYVMSPLFDLYLLTGQLSSSTFTGKDIRFLTTGECCIRIDDLGFICGTDSTVCFAYYFMNIFDSGGNLVSSVPLYSNNLFSDSSENFGDEIREYDIPYGSYKFYDVINFSLFDYDFTDLNTFDNYTVTFTFQFVSDGFNLFFPGTLEVIDFESYDSQVKHDDVVNSINGVTGSIDSAKSELSSEINQAASDISSSINSAKTEIVTSIDNASNIMSEGFSEVTGSINNASNNITNKLEETKNGLLDGIKSFFIPSEASMTEIKAEWDELLGNRFGALYEAGGIISDFGENMDFDTVKARGVKNTITMPAVTINLSGTPFTFGGYNVQIVPDGFDFLVDIVKGITSIVCTLAFVNALRKKYDKIVGGSSV